MTLAPRPAPHVVAGPGDAAVAMVSAGTAIARYAFSVTARTALDLVPLPRLRRAVQPRRWPATAAREAASALRTAEQQLSELADVLLPWVAREVLSRLDVVELVREFVDVDRIAARLDVDAVAARLDVAAVVERVDLDGIAAGLDLNTLVEKVDIARVIDRLDLDEIVGRVDIDRVIATLDLDRVIDRVDVDRVAARLDLDPVIERANVVAIARYVIEAIDLPELIRSSTASVTAETVRGVRDQGVDADRAVERVVDRLL
ncbi:MAG: hypothetical protein ACJ71Y_06045, partial [Blastococcus sp.]